MNTNDLVLNKLFTKNVFQELVNNKENVTYNKVIQRYIADISDKNNGVLISEIYDFMSKSYRNEYYYQNTLLNKLLLGKHSVNTTTALTQIPIGKSKADFILINGKAVVYEIKSERDSFERLNTQIKDYYKAFNHVCVVTSESNFIKLNNILRDTPVGILALTKRNTISNVHKKESIENNSRLNHLSIFKVLHKAEFENIINSHYGKLPVTSQVFYYDECFAMFSQIPLMQAYEMTIRQLKKRNDIVSRNIKIEDIPEELRSLVYFSNASNGYIANLHRFINDKYRR